MPKMLRVRVAQDEEEEKQVCKLAGSRHGPANWILQARMVARSPAWRAGGGDSGQRSRDCGQTQPDPTILLREGVGWRQTHSWSTPRDKGFVRNGPAVVIHYTQPPKGSTTSCTDELGPVVPRTFPPAAGWSGNGHRIKVELDDSRGPEETWVYGADAACAMARSSHAVPPHATP